MHDFAVHDHLPVKHRTVNAVRVYEFPEGRKRVEREDDLIHHRVTWCMLTNSFLLVAYFTTKNSDEYWRPLIALVGLVSSLSSCISIIAAWWAIWYLRENTKVSECGKKLYSPPHLALCGSYASVCAPFSILLIWIFILVCSYSSFSQGVVTIIFFALIGAFVTTWRKMWLFKENKLKELDKDEANKK